MMQIGKIMRNRFINNRGFTLIEAIAVLVILSIIAVAIISRGMSTAEVDLRARAEALKSHIRYVQIRAMNMTPADTTCNAAFGISATSNPYFMFRDCGKANRVALPGASGDTISLPSITIAATHIDIDNNVITFDNWGRPCTDLYGNTLATDDIILTLSHPAVTQDEIITITRNTGYVP